MSVIHGLSHKAIKHFRKYPSALAIYWIYASRTNNENVAFPSIAALARDTGWTKPTILKDRQWLVKCKALIEVPDYLRPEWRDLLPKDKARKLNLDKAEYYRTSGYIEIAGKRFSLLYFGAQETTDVETFSDVQAPCISNGVSHQTPFDMQAPFTELDSLKEELSPTKEIKNSLAENDLPDVGKTIPEKDLDKKQDRKQTNVSGENETSESTNGLPNTHVPPVGASQQKKRKKERAVLPKATQELIGKAVMGWEIMTSTHWSQVNNQWLADNLIPFQVTDDELLNFRAWFKFAYPKAAQYKHPNILPTFLNQMRTDVKNGKYKLQGTVSDIKVQRASEMPEIPNRDKNNRSLPGNRTPKGQTE